MYAGQQHLVVHLYQQGLKFTQKLGVERITDGNVYEINRGIRAHKNAPYTLGDVEGQDYEGCPATSSGHVYDYVARPAYAEVANVSDSGIRLARGQNLDLSVSKSFPVWEGLKLQTRFEAFNALHHPSKTGLDTWTDIFDPNFGTAHMHCDQQSNIPREVQLSMKLIWSD